MQDVILLYLKGKKKWNMNDIFSFDKTTILSSILEN